VLIAGFDSALAGAAARLVRSDGIEVELAVHRWRRPAGGEDRWLLDRCTGSTLDLGCGPGRLIEALLARGLPALGVDVSAVAETACRGRRVPMVRRDVFAPLPAEGQWDHALLADGNIGIGGDPLRLLRRAAELVRRGGTVLVETGGRPEELWRGTARVHTAAAAGASVPWAEAGASAVTRIAAEAGLCLTRCHTGARSFVELTVTASATAACPAASTSCPGPGRRSPDGQQQVVHDQREQRLSGEPVPDLPPGQQPARHHQPHGEREPDPLDLTLGHPRDVGEEDRGHSG
jgi:SAM-dependent methyltransferase